MNGAGPVLSPAGAPALAVAELSWTLIGGATLIFVAVMGLLVWAVRRRGEARDEAAPTDEPATRRAEDDRATVRLWLLGGGIAFPVVVLVSLFVYSRAVTNAGTPKAAADPLVVSVIGRDWWWELRYRDPAGGGEVVLANEIHLPAGRAVQLGLNSGDVIHSFWVPALAGKVDMVPGRVQQLALEVPVPGRHRGQCAEFCGVQHAGMAFEVVVDSPADFDAWLAAQARPAEAPRGAAAERGLALFRSEGCAACHAVRGLADGGGVGPDLTHVGSRARIGAGALPADAAGFARWIADVQRVKPGARMPSYERLDPAAIDALAAFMAGLQ